MSRFAMLQHIIDQLHVGDALNLKNSFPNDPMHEKCYATRISTARYFSRTFKYPITLLVAMFDRACGISGSRALAYFIPGSATIGSDWDSYVPGYKEPVEDMIYALSAYGVVSNLEGDAITSAISQDGSVTIKRAVLESLCSWILNMEPTEVSELMGRRCIEFYLLCRKFEGVDGQQHM